MGKIYYRGSNLALYFYALEYTYRRVVFVCLHFSHIEIVVNADKICNKLVSGDYDYWYSAVIAIPVFQVRNVLNEYDDDDDDEGPRDAHGFLPALYFAKR